jgi:hypothetical protein
MVRICPLDGPRPCGNLDVSELHSRQLETPEPTSAQLLLGAGALALVSDWDAWVARRVDSFQFAGDDERVLTRQQSVDFELPDLARRFEHLAAQSGGLPVPITFVNKWRLREFSLRDEADYAVSLLARDMSLPIAQGMLIGLGNHAVTGKLFPCRHQAMPARTRRLLGAIVAGEPYDALALCSELGSVSGERSDHDAWRSRLAAHEVFMSLAYELARGFVVFALYPRRAAGRRIVKLSYSSYVVPATHDRLPVRVGHLTRWVRQRASDTADSIAWQSSHRRHADDCGRIVFSTVGRVATDQVRSGGVSVACALAKVTGPDGARRTMRLRPNSAVAFEHAPPGRYVVKIKPRSGFDLDGPDTVEFTLGAGGVERVHIAAAQLNVAAPATLAVPLLAQPASLLRSVARGLGWHSKPLSIRVRVGDGGSYHCELEAPAGLHVTRARLVSDSRFTDGDDERARELDLVMASAQRAHLYASAHRAKPAAAYAYFDIRPRIETLVRPAMLTGWLAFLALLFVALTWKTNGGFKLHGPEDSSVLVVLLLGAPTALVAYFSQVVPSRVAFAMLYGLRLSALLPALLALADGAVMLVGQHRAWAHPALWALAGLSLGVMAVLAVARHWVLRPREQSISDRAQGGGFELRYSWPRSAGRSARATNTGGSETHSGSEERRSQAIRDEMLERAEGLSRPTRRMLLGQFGLAWREHKVPPALYFDSAETPPTFVGLGSDAELESVRSEVHDVTGDVTGRIRGSIRRTRRSAGDWIPGRDS